MKCVLKYTGAKWRLSEWIISFFPPHNVYLEAFCGSAAVFFHKPSSKQEIINDIDGNIVNFFKVCREWPLELATLVNLTPYARSEYDFARFNQNADDELERARRFYIQCFQGRVTPNAKNGWKRAVKYTGTHNPHVWNGLPDTLIEAAARLKDAHIENKPALELIGRYNMSDCLIYADPPYLFKSRSRGLYVHEMGSEHEHAEMLHALCRHSGSVVISGYDNDLYNDKLKGWRKERTTEHTHTAKKATEVLWIKYADGAAPNLNMFLDLPAPPPGKEAVIG